MHRRLPEMPTLEELRRWARGNRVQGMPNPLRRKSVEKPKLRGEQSKQFAIDPAGEDALLLFGKFRGSRASELVLSARGRKYLRWIVEDADFPEDLKNVCRYRLELWRREKQKAK